MPLPGGTGGRVSCQILPSDLPDSFRLGQCKVKWTTGKGWYKCHTDLSKCTHVLFMWLVLHTHVKKKMLNSICLKLDFILGFGGFLSVLIFLWYMTMQKYIENMHLLKMFTRYVLKLWKNSWIKLLTRFYVSKQLWFIHL